MKAFQLAGCSILLMVSFFCSFTFAQSNDVYSFSITEGAVVVTPARCIEYPCDSTKAVLSGKFVAQIQSGRELLFTSSNVTTDPEVYFELPLDPNEDSNGTRREASFTFDGKTLTVEGVIDSRAFDGPLMEYRFIANLNDLGYFTAVPDLSVCASPHCGGYYLKAVNKKLTRCADGNLKPECYVAELVYGDRVIDLHQFYNGAPFLLVGAIEAKRYIDFPGHFGRFIAKSVHRAATHVSPTDKFYGIENNGIVCISTPCFSFNQLLLNTINGVTQLSDINLEKSGANKDDIEQAYALLANGATLYAAGRNKTYHGFAGKGIAFVAEQFYLPVKLNPDCMEGYNDADGICRTPYGCPFPEIEQTGFGGAPLIDPITKVVKPSVVKSCVKECTSPAMLVSAGQCHIYYP